MMKLKEALVDADFCIKVGVSSDISSIGKIRLTRESDMSFLPYWIEGFNSDCFGSALQVNAIRIRRMHISF